MFAWRKAAMQLERDRNRGDVAAAWRDFAMSTERTETDGAVVIDRRPLSGPFPNLRSRELVKMIVGEIVDTCTHCKFTPGEQHAFSLGIVRGAIETAKQFGGDGTLTVPFLLDLLSRLNQGGVPAVHLLLEQITGRERELETEADVQQAA